jgi:hypothetical protein
MSLQVKKYNGIEDGDVFSPPTECPTTAKVMLSLTTSIVVYMVAVFFKFTAVSPELLSAISFGGVWLLLPTIYDLGKEKYSHFTTLTRYNNFPQPKKPRFPDPQYGDYDSIITTYDNVM